MDNRFSWTVLVGIAYLGLLVLAQSPSLLQCYQCSPTDTNTDCSNHTLAQIVNCSDIFGPSSDTSDLKISCYSAYINYTGLLDLSGNSMDNETGMYRSCGMHSQEYDNNYCDWFRSQMQIFNAPIPFCDSCNASVCNTHRYDVSNEDGNNNNSANMICLSFVLWAVSVGLINGF